MVILTSNKYNELINKIKDYDSKLDSAIKREENLHIELLKLKNKIQLYKDVNNKRDNKMKEQLYRFIDVKLSMYDTTANELNKLFQIYFNLEETLDGDSND